MKGGRGRREKVADEGGRERRGGEGGGAGRQID